MLLGRLYGPADLYSTSVPWQALSLARGDAPPANPILSDLAFANIPWRAAVREAVANGRFPFWNRFVLAGNPLLASAQAGIFHPATWAGILLPLALSWTFSCTFTIFLALLAGFLYFRDFDVSDDAALVGACAWGFSTYLVFWAGWSVGPSTATFPLLLLGLRRIARGEERGVTLTTAALVLSVTGGHPESFFHTAAAGGAVFLADLALSRRGTRGALLRAAGAGLLAFLLGAPQILPLLEAVPHSAEYRARRARLDAGVSSQSVAAAEAARRLLPAILPFAHGIYGRSSVQAQREDGSGMPLAYAGAVLFPLAAVGFAGKRRGRWMFAALVAAGLLLGASAPGLIDLLTRLPGFSLALNYRLVLLVPLGLAGLAAFGAEETRRPDGAGVRRLAAAAFAAAAAAGALALAAGARGVFSVRELSSAFVAGELFAEILPLVLLAAAAAIAGRSGAPGRRRGIATAALILLVVQRGAEMAGVYPTLPASALAPPVPLLESARAPGARVVAAGNDLRPNGGALYSLEDVRGYESIVLDRFEDTFPLWCARQPASFNRVDADALNRPFLDFLGARFAAAAPGAPVPAGWQLRGRDTALSLFENPRALPRAFLPARLRGEITPERTLEEMTHAIDFSDVAWVRGGGTPAPGGELVQVAGARLSCRTEGPDLLIAWSSEAPVFAATSLPDWPGWRAAGDSGALPLATVDHAFVGLWLPAGEHRARISYRPPSFTAGLAAAGSGIVAAAVLLFLRRHRASGDALRTGARG